MAAGCGSADHIDGRIQGVDRGVITDYVIDVYIGIIGPCETHYRTSNARITINHHFRKMSIVLAKRQKRGLITFIDNTSLSILLLTNTL